MATNEEITALETEIARLTNLITSATNSVTQDGQTTGFDLKEARQSRRELRDELAKCKTENGTATPKRRPPIVQIDLS